MSYTLTETGKALTETQDGVTMPVDYSFAAVNDYVHGVDRFFEELQWLALGMATEIDKLRSALTTSTNGLRHCARWNISEEKEKALMAVVMENETILKTPNAQVTGAAPTNGERSDAL
jgi:hypothetical protein